MKVNKSISEQMQDELEPIINTDPRSRKNARPPIRENLRADTSRTGDIAEYYAVTWLWDEGYEVFKNCGCSGMIDLIAYKDGKTTLIDVKSSYPRIERKNSRKVGVRTQAQKEADIRVLIFHPNTRKLRWQNHLPL